MRLVFKSGDGKTLRLIRPQRDGRFPRRRSRSAERLVRRASSRFSGDNSIRCARPTFAILRRAGFDIEHLCARLGQPFPQILATNSGPLSERICYGTPFMTITSANASITFALLHHRSGRQQALPNRPSVMRLSAHEVVVPESAYFPASPPLP